LKRKEAIAAIANAIAALPGERPQRVAVNGRIASGKTTLASELADAVRAQGRPVLHVGVDGFHNPIAIRYRQGRSSARGYYEDAYDLDAVGRLLLQPLGMKANSADGLWSIRTCCFDLDTDMPINEAPEAIVADTVLVVDGSFLLVPKLRSLWDYVVFLDVDRAIAAMRGAKRDSDRLGGFEPAKTMHEERYQTACDFYISENQPQNYANAIWSNADFERPVLRFRSG
jgi:uridine kinase